MSYSRVGVVTGANKGIGLAIVRQLALRYPSSGLNNGPLLIYLTARDKSRGEAALKNLQSDPQLTQAAALKEHGGPSTITFHELDIVDDTSVSTFVAHLGKQHGKGRVDFLVNNAGIAMDGFDASIVKTTLACNYTATLRVSNIFLDSLLNTDTGRLVNLASSSGHLNKYSPAIRNRFLAATAKSDVDAILAEFLAAVEAGRENDAGFPSAAYAVSKAGLIAGTRLLAREVEQEGSRVVVNSCCPGYVNTDMSKGNGTKSPDEGAATPVELVLGDLGGVRGEFWRDGRVVEW